MVRERDNKMMTVVRKNNDQLQTDLLASAQNFGTAKPVLSGHSKIDKTRMLMTNGTLMKVESIAECSPCSIL